ncbi:TetR/AcrR family transcriptional regulator [soil metagenome]
MTTQTINAIAAPFAHPDEDPRRAAILRHARRAFMSGGFAATRIEPIARVAGVSTATVYTYFGSKDDLFSAVIADAANDFQRQMETVRDAAGPVRQRLIQFMTAYALFMADPFVRSVFRLVMAERPRFRDVAMRFFERGRSDFGGPLIAALSELQARGELATLKPSWAAGQLMGMIEHPVFFMPLVTGDEVLAARSIDHIVEDAVTTFLARHGIGSDAVAPQG